MKEVQARLFWIASAKYVHKRVHIYTFSCGADAGLQAGAGFAVDTRAQQDQLMNLTSIREAA
jgi:hypothetical protein